ncbi:MAG TPA: response regulator transcription factor [Planctomycetota bacterium]|nr:response regulator transcription factor [Planctomycetota bacterium]
MPRKEKTHGPESKVAPKRQLPAEKGKAIRVLVVEDHTIVRDGLVALLREEPDLEVVGQVGDGRPGVEQWKKHRPDITLMDLQMPGMDGVTAIEQIRALDPGARIIVLTTYSGDEDIYRAIRAGAKAYVLKDIRSEHLFRCIRNVHRGRTLIPPGIAAKLAERLPAEELTAKELEVLRLLVQGKPNKLIGADLSITELTVKTHVKSLFRKLNVLSRTEAVAVAARKGLLRL